MVRKIIEIDREKCNGCGLCASACHEGAIGMVDGKAQLLRDDYCDGLGNCLPVCPTGAIRFIEREAAAYDEKAVQENMKRAQSATHSGCPGSRAQAFAPRTPSRRISTVQTCSSRPTARPTPMRISIGISSGTASRLSAVPSSIRWITAKN